MQDICEERRFAHQPRVEFRPSRLEGANSFVAECRIAQRSEPRQRRRDAQMRLDGSRVLGQGKFRDEIAAHKDRNTITSYSEPVELVDPRIQLDAAWAMIRIPADEIIPREVRVFGAFRILQVLLEMALPRLLLAGSLDPIDDILPC